MQVRIAVLNENAELRQLHTTLVINGPLSEEDFWSQRQHMLEYQKWQRSQKRGQQGTVVNVRPAEGEGSDVKFVFNDDIVASILSQFPPVRKAYEATVSTGKVSKETFLRMFLESKYYNRKSLPDAKAADEFFSKYEDEDDDDYVLNPKTALYESNNYLLDLQAQIEDHGHTGNTPDPTMRPGGVKAALPLIRQFNRVSEGVLNANKRPIAKSTKRPQADDVYRDATELEDLVIKPPPARRPLEIRDSSGYFSQASVSDTNIAVQDAQSMVESFNDRVLQWQLNLPNAPIDRHHSGKVLENVSATVKKRKLSLAVSTDIKVSAQIHTTHLALVELLRNFWTAKAQKQDQKMTQIATTMRTMMKAASSLEDESHGKFFAGIRESFQKALQSA
ncbi:hypothetical protein BC832DRAFT_69680 [Gaertneriomyces semiglobifer]|nr:hypothetical protein BC832DRAFT_69680 [Gaertneriomyces semiglobifer]